MTMFKSKLQMAIMLILIMSISSLSILKADDEKEEHEREGKVSRFSNSKNVPLIVNQKWKAECSSCHMLYPPYLLPSKSWSKMMSSLDKHFGENAELDLAAQKEITDYLLKYSADQTGNRRFNNNEDVLRISETKYFKRKHSELNPNIYKRKSIGSASNCLACHSGAEQGDFSEHNVRIPKENAVPVKK
jgi:hypothetical protein